MIKSTSREKFKFLSIILCFIFALSFSSFLNFESKVLAEDKVMPGDQFLLNKISAIGYDVEDPDVFAVSTYLNLKDANIYSLTGLDFWNFPVLKTLDLTGNRIINIEPSSFSTMPKLETLILSKNRIVNIDLTGLNLKKLDIDNNQLSEINLNCFSTTDSNIIANLNSNQFSDLEKVTFPSDKPAPFINLCGNFITTPTDKPNIELLLQGVKNGTRIAQNIDVTLFPSKKYVNLEVKINDEILSGKKTISYGNYSVNFKNGSKILGSSDGVSTLEFSIVPNKPTITFYQDGKAVKFVNLFEKAIEIKAVSNIENAEIFISLNGVDWTKSNNINIKITGNFSVTFKTVIQNVESDHISVNFTVKTVKTFWFFIIAVVFVFILISIYFLFYRFKNKQ